MPIASVKTARPLPGERAALASVDRLTPEIESALRMRAFRAFYDKTYADEHDLTVRFAKALIASAGPIVDPEAALEWHRQHRKKSRKTPCATPTP